MMALLTRGLLISPRKLISHRSARNYILNNILNKHVTLIHQENLSLFCVVLHPGNTRKKYVYQMSVNILNRPISLSSHLLYKNETLGSCDNVGKDSKTVDKSEGEINLKKNTFILETDADPISHTCYNNSDQIHEADQKCQNVSFSNSTAGDFENIFKDDIDISELKPSSESKQLASAYTEDFNTPEHSLSIENNNMRNELSENVDISELRPKLPRKALNLAAYVNRSETLSNLVKLGVDLSKIEKDSNLANRFLRMDFAKDVMPYISFFKTIGMADEDLAKAINKNPALFWEDLDDIQVRINYFESKNFLKKDICRIISMGSKILSLPTVEIDQRLGVIQKEFKLTGNQVRKVVVSFPQVVLLYSMAIREHRIALHEFTGFTEEESVQVILGAPRLLQESKTEVVKRFDYLHNTMGISHQLIVAWPKVLRKRLISKIKPRHEFMKLLGRDQYDPTKENYVSLESLLTGTDEEFCKKVAKVNVQSFYNFHKTM